MDSRQEIETKNTKKTVGYWLWRVAFLVFYPFIAVFTFVFTTLLNLLSGLSKGLARLLGGGRA